MLRTAAEAARSLGLVRRRLLLAVSGGLDSTVLAHAFSALRDRLSLELAIGHVNHGLRGAAARADEQAVRNLGATLGMAVHVRRVDPEALRARGPSRTRPTLEEAARTLRYRALREVLAACGADAIATAHTANDQAETVLLRLLRGCGPDGLAGIPERSPDGRIVRPLLRVTRSEIASYARAQGLRWREDESNGDARFARSRLRRRWLAALETDFNPRLLRALGDLAEAQRRDSEWMERIVESEAPRWIARDPGAEGARLTLARAGWGELPDALARRLVRRALRQSGVGRDVSRVHIERMLGFLRAPRAGRRIELPGARVLACGPDAFRLEPARPAGAASAAPGRSVPAARRVGPGGAC